MQGDKDIEMVKVFDMKIENTFYTDELIYKRETAWDLHDEKVLKNFPFLEKYRVLLCDNTIILSVIIVKKEFREKGHGTFMLNEICHYADEHKLKIVLTPTADWGSDLDRLEIFYRKLGFVKNSGINEIINESHRMYRMPE